MLFCMLFKGHKNLEKNLYSLKANATEERKLVSYTSVSKSYFKKTAKDDLFFDKTDKINTTIERLIFLKKHS